MNDQQIINYWNNHKWFTVGICYRHINELRTAYFRANSIQQAIIRFNEVSNEPILKVWLFDEGDIIE